MMVEAQLRVKHMHPPHALAAGFIVFEDAIPAADLVLENAMPSSTCQCVCGGGGGSSGRFVGVACMERRADYRTGRSRCFSLGRCRRHS
jgi:hypothetical protein